MRLVIENKMERNLEIYPSNETGDLLWQLLNAGIVLGQEHEVEFSVIFKTEEQALGFGQLLLENNQKLSFTPYPASETHPWEITAYPAMPLSVQNLAGYSQLLIDNASGFDGEFDGWYTPAQQVLSE